MRKRVQEGPAKSGMLSHLKRMHNIAEAKSLAAQELGEFTARDWWMLGLGLYINANPNAIRLAAKWFREARGLINE